MKRFAELLDRLAYQPQRNAKLRLLVDHFSRVPDPERGYALAALTGGLDFALAKAGLIRGLVTERVDPVLFELSYDYVGDLAETVSLIWPEREGAGNAAPTLTDVIETLNTTGKANLPGVVAGWLDALDADGRWALIKLMTGGLRIGVSARLAKTAVAQFGDIDVAEIEELWHALEPPYEDLFAWLGGVGPKPDPNLAAAFRPVMLAHPLDEPDLEKLDPADFLAEWKWDGARVQIAADGGRVRLYTRSGDEVSRAFPEVVEAVDFQATLDGELLVMRDGVVAPFGDLQRRLNRKTVGAKLRADYPCAVRLYDILIEAGDDLRSLPFADRRARLETWIERTAHPGLDLSPTVPFSSWDELADLRRNGTEPGVEGLMLKRADSAYMAGRPKGLWFKWKRDPALVDAVVMYAQRGHGKRSSFYSDYTFGVWRGGELVPVGKAYFGFTDAELRDLDRWVRANTINRFGPVREVEKSLVVEVAFEGLQRSTRHKSGLAMRFPRFSRIRWDKPAEEADVIENLEALLPG